MVVSAALLLSLLVLGHSTPAWGNLHSNKDATLERLPDDATRNSSNHTHRITGGKYVSEGQIPWQVALFTHSGVFFCGGSIISPSWVLTAAHCVEWEVRIRLVFGRVDLGAKGNGGVRQMATFFVMHEQYDSKNVINDIALIRTKRPLKFGELIGAVPLPSRKQKSARFFGQTATTCGWGTTSNAEGPKARIPPLSCMSNRIISMKKCSRSFDNITKTQICLDSSDGGNSCSGDSGGPLLWKDVDGKDVLIGVVSFGSKVCQDGDPGVYTRVGAYLNWISRITGISIRP